MIKDTELNNIRDRDETRYATNLETEPKETELFQNRVATRAPRFYGPGMQVLIVTLSHVTRLIWKTSLRKPSSFGTG